MNNKKQYLNKKKKLLSDTSICLSNRKLFKEFFLYEENKLKRSNGLASLDEACYKTLIEYCSRFRTVNKFFKNKSWYDLTKKDIEKVWNNLEDGKIKNRFGKRYKNRRTYYNKILKSKPFELAGKKELAKEAIQYTQKEDSEVKFVTEEGFKTLQAAAARVDQKLLLWLAWDIGENVSSLLRLKKKDFTRQMNEITLRPEYFVNLKKEILKRSRRPRRELTNYPDTALFLDVVLKDLKENENLFRFGPRQAMKFFDRLILQTKIKCLPDNQKPTWKDLRSGMACHLLKERYTREEVNSRLGHVPSSAQIDKYINFLALDKSQPKKKIINNSLDKLNDRIEKMARHIAKLDDERTMQLASPEIVLKAIEKLTGKKLIKKQSWKQQIK